MKCVEHFQSPKCPAVLQQHDCHRHRWDVCAPWIIWTMFSSSILPEYTWTQHQFRAWRFQARKRKCHVCPRAAEWTGGDCFQQRYFYPLAPSNWFTAAFIREGVVAFITALGESEALAFTWPTDKHDTRLATVTSLCSLIEMTKPRGNSDNWDTSCYYCRGSKLISEASKVNRRIVSGNNFIPPWRSTLCLIVVSSSSLVLSSDEVTPPLPPIHEVHGSVKVSSKTRSAPDQASRSMIETHCDIDVLDYMVLTLACSAKSQQLLSWPAAPN